MKKVFFIFAILLIFADISSAQEWVLTNGPGGGFNQIVFNKKKDIFLCSGTLTRSTDNGRTWVQISPEDSLQIRKWRIAIAPNQEIYTINMDSSHLWKSTNNGNSWKRIYLGNISIESILISPDGTIIIPGIQNNGDFGSLCISADSGKTWVFNPISIHGDGNVTTLSKGLVCAIDSNGAILLSDKTRFLCSTDKGTTWQEKVFSNAPTSIACGKEGNIFLSEHDTLYLSTDDGLHWQPISLKADWIPYGTQGLFSASPGGRIIFVGLASTLYSDDNGIHWQEWANKIPNSFVVPWAILAPDTDSGFYFCYGEYSVHSEKPSIPWDRVLFPTSTVFEMKSFFDGTILAFNGSIWRSENGRESWQFTPANIANTETKFVLDSEKNILLLQGSGVRVSSDSGKNWDFLSFAVSYGDIHDVCIHPNGTIFAATDNGVSISSNNGIHWDLSTDISKSLYALSVDRKGTLYAGGGNNFYRSRNSGKNWDLLFIGNIANQISCLVTNIYNDVYLFDLGSTVFRSIDLGETWTPFNDGLTCTTVHSMIELPDGSIAAATDNGVFILSLGDCKWRSFSSGLWNLNILSLACTPQGELFAGAEGVGVFKSTKAFNVMPKLTGRLLTGDIDFGSVAVGDTLCRDVFIMNTGLAPITVTKSYTVIDPLPFSIDPESIAQLPVTLDPKESVLMRVCFHPPQPANYISEIDWSTDIDPSFCAWIEGKSFLHGTTSKSSVRTSVALHSFSINPNPASGNLLKVSFAEALPPSSVISVFDVLGREVYHTNLSAGQKEFDLPIRELSEGMYYVRVETDGATETKQFIKLK